MSQDNQYYVCVGASAGGLEALENFFKAVPNNTGLIFIVIQHLSPDYKSLMDELLARYTDMKIQVIKDGDQTFPNQVYLIPPKKILTIFHGKLYLENKKSINHLNLPIDIFMKSLAKDQGKKAIGIILSGTGSDGTIGVRSIKEAGGMVMVQNEETAKFDGMPKSSISTGLVDYILPPENMAKELISFIKHPYKDIELNTNDDSGDDYLTKISLIMREFCGIDFSYYKESTILRRLDRRIKINKLDSLTSYVDLIRASDEEKSTLQREFLIGVTTFFRDTEAFESLRVNVLPNIDYSKGTVRVWSAACSTGEEVYSLAILFQEYMAENNIHCEIKLFATDVDSSALEVAGKGFYVDSLIGDVDSDILEKYFTQETNGYRISETIRNMVVFAKHNILKDPPFSKLDLLVCRNMFIYIKSQHQKQIFSNFYFSLNSTGFMFIGSSETIGDLSKAFTTIDSKWKIYRCRDGFQHDLPHDISYAKSRKVPLAQHRLDPKANKLALQSEMLLSAALTQIAPPSIIIDSNDKIIQVINDVSIIISMQPGKVSDNFNTNMNKEDGLFVNNVLRRLKNDGKDVIFKNISLKSQGDVAYSITGKKLRANNSDFFMISFIKNEIDLEESNLIEFDMSEEVKNRVKQLEHELHFAQEGLQATVEELETSNEELQSSNEELIASNEELQSTNEELQSVNEELYSVNSEYQSKIEELTNTTNDLNNLIRNTNIGALYLDEKLCIRRVSPIICDITNILDSDVGRPIKQISVMENYPSLLNDIDIVIETLSSIDKEIIDIHGTFWLVRIRPYRTEYNAVNGVMVTFINIDNLKGIQNDYNAVNERLDKILSIGRMAYWFYDVATGHLDFSSTKAVMLGYTQEEFPHDFIERNLLIHKDDIEKYSELIELCRSGAEKSWDVTYRIKRKDGTYALHHDHGVVEAFDVNNRAISMVGIITELSDYDLSSYIKGRTK